MFDALLAWVALVEGLGIFALAGLVLVHALGWSCLEKRGRRRLEWARSRLLAVLEDEGVGEDRLEPLQPLSRGQQVRLFSQLLPNLKGSRRGYLTGLAREMGLTAWAESMCRSRFWWRRLQGIRLLTLLDGGEDLVPSLLQDSHPAVRCQAVEWAADHPTASVIDGLIKMLGNQGDPVRFSIQDSLLRIGYPATGPLRQALTTSTATNLVGLLEIATELASPQFLSIGLNLSRHHDPSVRGLAARLLGALGGSEAAEALTGLLSDRDAGVRQAAAGALGKLGPLARRYDGGRVAPGSGMGGTTGGGLRPEKLWGAGMPDFKAKLAG